MNTKSLIKLSMIIDKMGIKDLLVNINKETQQEAGKEIMSLLISNLYKAETEIYEFLASYYKITIEEAEDKDVVIFFKELLKIEGLKDFLARV